MGQCYALFGWADEEDEVNAYIRMVNKIIDAGYMVVWKGHPRLDDSYFDRISEKCEPGMIVKSNVQSQIPIEFVAERLGLYACVSVASTSLFYLKYLYGIKTFTYASEFSKRLSRDSSIIHNLVECSIEPVSEFR